MESLKDTSVVEELRERSLNWCGYIMMGFENHLPRHF